MLMLVAGYSGGCGERSKAAPDTVRISAAASIAYVIEGLSVAIEHDLDVRIEVNAGASGMLARQIMRGERADLFISAHPSWVDQLAEQNLVDPASRVLIVSNRLVVIGLTDSIIRPKALEDLKETIYQPIALGDPAYVPAGRYAVQALTAHGLDTAHNLKLAEAPNVRAALAYVKSGQCPLGLVYASDALGEDGLEVLLTIDPADHDPIVYPAVVLLNSTHHDTTMRVLTWLQGEKAQAAFEEAGFMRP